MQTPSMVQLANATQNIVRSHSGIQMLFEDNA
jgi:hypothetical protein